MFASTSAKADRGYTKDTVANIRETGVFCCNVVSDALKEAMNESSGPWGRETDEFAHTGLDRAPCQTIDCSRVAAAPANLECRMTQIIELEGQSNFLVLGTVTGVHIREDALKDGRFDVSSFSPVSRLGYRDFAKVTELFEMARPGE